MGPLTTTEMPPGTYVATSAEREWMLADHVVAGRPTGPTSGWGMQHLFRRPGEWSLCEEAVWLAVIRAEIVNEHTWICSRCQAEALAASVRSGVCPACRAPLSDPRRSPGGWSHCRACRRGWLVTDGDGAVHPLRQDWPERATA